MTAEIRDLHAVRREYSRQSLSEQDCNPNPVIQFEKWLDDAADAQVPEPNAVNIATAGENHRPSARMVLLKEVRPEGFVFFTNYLSRKGRELALNPYAAMTFFWPELERQVRIEGAVSLLPAEDSDTYFDSRPYPAQIGAWASPQSEVISGKAALLTRAAASGVRYPVHVPRPPHWGGYLVRPESVEFWQGRPSRLHDRMRYRLDNGVWILERLAP